jgi:hypothetical protein
LRNLPSRFAKARLLPKLILQPSGFLYNPRNAESYTLSEAAACLLKGLLCGVAPDEVWRELPARFEVSEKVAQRDSLIFLRTLHELKLLSLPPQDELEPDDEQEDATDAP